MKNKKVIATQAKPKLSFAVSLLSEISSFIHFGLLAMSVLLVINTVTFTKNVINRPRSDVVLGGIPARIDDELRNYRNYAELPEGKYIASVEAEAGSRIQVTSVKNLETGEVYTGTFTLAEVLPSNSLAQYIPVGSYGTLNETLVDSEGITRAEFSRDIYDISTVIRHSVPKGNGILLLQVMLFVRVLLFVFIGFLISNAVCKFFKNIRSGNFFLAENVRYLRSSGLYSFMIPLVPLLLNLIILIVSSKGDYYFAWATNTSMPTSWPFVLISALFFMLSEIIQRGYELQLDKDMTI